MIVTIMCGGGGTRLWPLSRLTMPKQFAKLLEPHESKSLYQQTLLRNAELADEFLIFVNKDQLHLAKMQYAECNLENKVRFVAEPFGRNTAAVIAIASVLNKDDASILVIPSDHHITNEVNYVQTIKNCQPILDQEKICLFGIKPDHPETGFGYIEASGEKVISFKEKPDLSTAQNYLLSGNYFWNSGIFAFKSKIMKINLEIFKPQILANAQKVQLIEENDRTIFIPHALMDGFEDISIDYAVIEKSESLAIKEALDWDWSDLGSFESLKKLRKTLNQDVHFKGSNNSLVISNKETILIDVDDLIVVDTGDALLISKNGSSAKVKEVLSELKNQNLKKDHLTVIRPWGSYTVLADEAHYKAKRIQVYPGKRLSLQKHQYRSEVWTVIKGTATVTIDDKKMNLSSGQSCTIAVGSVHRLENTSHETIEIVEVQTGISFAEEDIIRLEDDFHRA